MMTSGLAAMKSAKIDFMAGPLASSGPQLCQTVRVTGSGAVVAVGASVGCGAVVAGGFVAGAAVGVLAAPQALRTMETITSSAVVIQIVFLFILFSSFLWVLRSANDNSER